MMWTCKQEGDDRLRAVLVALGFLGGAAIEVLNAFTRQWTVGRMHGSGAMGWIMGALFLRLLATSAVFLLAFRADPLAGVAALLGYTVSRWVMVWRLHRQTQERGEGS